MSSNSKKYELVELPPELEDILEPKSKKNKSEKHKSSKHRDEDKHHSSEHKSKKHRHHSSSHKSDKHKNENYETESKSHKHKKSKKEKNEDESTHTKVSIDKISNNEESSSENPKPTVSRDSWMTLEPDNFLHFDSKSEQNRDLTQPKQNSVPDQGFVISSREANPYLNGTKQLPEDEPQDSMYTGPPSIEQLEPEHQPMATYQVDKAALTDQLNRLNSKLLKAKLKKNHEEVKILEKEYAQLQAQINESMLSQLNQISKEVVVLPEFDIRGKHVDIGSDTKPHPTKPQTEDPDSNTSSTDINTLAKLERQSNGMEYDQQLANQISRDGGFKNDLDYMNDRMSHLSKESTRSDLSKRHLAINDYKRSEKAIERCFYCFKDERTAPATPVISLGHRAYLGLPNVQELVPGHCQIVPIEHSIATLDCDDDTWDEIRNFMKCLIRCFDAKNCGVIFMETVIDLKSYYHTVIECIPLPYDQYDDAPAYFKESLLESDSHWSQHAKVIDTSKRGFRRSLTSNLPYFHVWYHLDEGMGHVIEERERFPQWFGKEVIAGMLDLDPSKWRRPTRYSTRDNTSRVDTWKEKFKWKDYDWTGVLDDK